MHDSHSEDHAEVQSNGVRLLPMKYPLTIKIGDEYLDLVVNCTSSFACRIKVCVLLPMRKNYKFENPIDVICH